MALKRSLPLLAGALAAAALAAPAQAQLPSITPFSFEARAGLALPQGDLGELVETGYTVSGSVTYHAIPMIGLYAGYTYSRFGVEDVDDFDIIDQGFDVGARLAIPTPLIPIDPWIRGGLVIHDLDGSGEGVEEADNDTKLGFEVGAGLGFGFGPISLTPGISFVQYSFDSDEEDGTVKYIKADIGVRIRI